MNQQSNKIIDVNMILVDDYLIKGGCTLTATIRINSKTAAKKSYRKATAGVWFKIITYLSLVGIMMIVEAVPAPKPARTSAEKFNTFEYSVTSQQQHHRQHLHKKQKRDLNKEWMNPCNAHIVKDKTSDRRTTSFTARNVSYLLIKSHIETEEERLTHNNVNAIRTDNMEKWFNYHNQTYKFLGRIRPTAGVTLRKWHRDLQIYTGAFYFLHLKQNHTKFHIESEIISELKELMISSKRLLCEIETAINYTNTRLPKRFTTDEMKKKLTFRSENLYVLENTEVHLLDLRFSKLRYKEYCTDIKASIDRWQKKQQDKNLTGQKKRRRGGNNTSASRRRLNSSYSTSDESSYYNDSLSSSRERRRHKSRNNRRNQSASSAGRNNSKPKSKENY